MSWTHAQITQAQALQRKGFTLREIAGQIGQPYEEVTLLLFGGVMPEIKVTESPPAKAAGQAVASVPLAAETSSVENEAAEISTLIHTTHPTKSDALQAGCAPYRPAETGVDGNGLRMKGEVDGSHDRPSDQPGAGVRGNGALAEDGFTQCEDDAPPALPTPSKSEAKAGIEFAVLAPGRPYRLKNAQGLYLHESANGFTSNVYYAYAQPSDKIEKLLERDPVLAELSPELVP